MGFLASYNSFFSFFFFLINTHACAHARTHTKLFSIPNDVDKLDIPERKIKVLSIHIRSIMMMMLKSSSVLARTRNGAVLYVMPNHEYTCITCATTKLLTGALRRTAAAARSAVLQSTILNSMITLANPGTAAPDTSSREKFQL